jgi:hypothetical protein
VRGDHADGRNILDLLQVGSHYHFGEANSALDLIATQAGICGWISLRALPLVEPDNDGGPADRDWRAATDLRVQPAGYGGSLNGTKIASQADYAAMFGPTTGDKLAGGYRSDY